MNLSEMVALTAQNIGVRDVFERAEQVAGENTAQAQWAQAEAAKMKSRLVRAINGAYMQAARTFFPLRMSENVALSQEGWVTGDKLSRRVVRYRSIQHEGRAQAFMQHGDGAEVFAPGGVMVRVTYDALPNALVQDDDAPEIGGGRLPGEALCLAAAAQYFAEDGQRSAAAFWDARYKDMLAQVRKDQWATLPGRVWR
nr:hypothetical protein [bacterium]